MYTATTYPLPRLAARTFVMVLVAAMILSQGQVALLSIYGGILGGVFFYTNAPHWTFYPAESRRALRAAGVICFLIAFTQVAFWLLQFVYR